MDNSKLNMRMNQIEEQLSHTLKAVDKLTEDVAIFWEYAIERNKVVKEILRKLNGRAETRGKFDNRKEFFLLELIEQRRERKQALAEQRRQRELELADELSRNLGNSKRNGRKNKNS